MREGKDLDPVPDRDPYLLPTDPDANPRGPKTNGSGSGTPLGRKISLTLFLFKIPKPSLYFEN